MARVMPTDQRHQGRGAKHLAHGRDRRRLGGRSGGRDASPINRCDLAHGRGLTNRHPRLGRAHPPTAALPASDPQRAHCGGSHRGRQRLQASVRDRARRPARHAQCQSIGAARDAGAFPDTNIAEDRHLAARLARRGPFICLDEPVRVHHRHPAAARNAFFHQGGRTAPADVCRDCLSDTTATATQRLLAAILRRAGRRNAAQGTQPSPERGWSRVRDRRPSTPQVAE